MRIKKETRYWAWWVYGLIGMVFIVLSLFSLPTVWRLIISLAIFWYGMSTGIGLHKHNVKNMNDGGPVCA